MKCTCFGLLLQDLYNNELVGLSYIERPILGDNPKAHKPDNEKRVLFVKSVHFS